MSVSMVDTKRMASIALAVALALGCSDERPTQPTESSEGSVYPGLANGAGGFVDMASAGISFTVPPDVFGVEVGNVLTLSAHKRADGTVIGQFNYHQMVFGETFKFTGPVTCVNVYDGNRAKVGGLIRNSNDPVFVPGFFIWWQLIDNGEGAAAEPDASTISGFGDEQENEEFCDSPAPPRFGPHPVNVGGNVQVGTTD